LGAELILKGDNVIQNNCTLYSCIIEQGAYIGHNSVILEGAIIQKGAIVAPNSVVPPGRVVKERQVWAGNPIKYVRKAKEQEGFVTLDYARHANLYGEAYNNAFLPFSNAYLYRHGASDVLPTLRSPSKGTSTSTKWTNRPRLSASTLLRPRSVATDAIQSCANSNKIKKAVVRKRS
jgi:hypothetical protein